MSIAVNINGNIVRKDRAMISIFDHGFLFGDSVYEVVVTWKGRLFAVNKHLDRLGRSANEISLSIPWNHNRFQNEIVKTIDSVENKESYVRIIVTRGQGEINIDPSSCKVQNVIIIVNELIAYPEEYYEKGVRVTIVHVRRNYKKSINPAIKTGNYLNNVLAIIEAKKMGAYDGLMLNMDNIVSECTTSNFFIVKDGMIKTPSIECGILEGVTRGIALHIAGKNNIHVAEITLSPEEIFEADEAFVTSTTKGVMPVTWCDKKKIGTGDVGSVTKKMMRLYEEELDSLIAFTA